MREFAAKQKQTQKDNSIKPAGLAYRSLQAVSRMLQSPGQNSDVDLSHTTPISFGHDFSRIPVHGKTPLVIQPKLTISTPGDMYEQEADRLADQVMRKPEQQLQNSSADGNAKRDYAEHTHLQTKAMQATDSVETAVPPILHEVLSSPGQPLDAATREFMEPRFGHDFSQMRVHTGVTAAEAASAIDARAFTVGRKIVFGAGEYAPASNEGRLLLAHELSHVLQHRSLQLIQRKTPIDKFVSSSSNPAELAEPKVAEQAVRATDEPKKLRIAAVRYDQQGQPLDEKLSAVDHTRLTALLVKLQKDDPTFYAAIESEDLVVTRGTLPTGNVGKHVLSVSQRSRTSSALRWFLVDHAGVDLSLGEPDVNSEAWQKAVALFSTTFPDPQKQEELTNKKETRVISGGFSSVLILDLDQIDAREKAYQVEYDKYRTSSDFNRPELPQSALATLRHESGHLLFERAIQYDKLGNVLPSKTLPAELKSQVKQYSLDEDIATDLALLSEYAAESVEHGTEPFDLAKFKEENDPRFGIGGYHDLDGNEQSPTGFGVRMATGLTLVVAKQTARDLKAIVEAPVMLLTVPKPKTEQRRFDVLMLAGLDKQTVRDKFEQLKKDFPVLTRYKTSVVAF